MPELPEVETTIRGLNILKNKKVIKVNLYTKKLRFNIPTDIYQTLKHQRIIEIERLAKYILVKFKNNITMIIHLGMSGRIKIFNSNFTKKKHDHIIISFKNCTSTPLSTTILFAGPSKWRISWICTNTTII